MERKKKVKLHYSDSEYVDEYGVARKTPDFVYKIGYLENLFTRTKEFYSNNNQNAIMIVRIKNDRKLSTRTVYYIEIDNIKYKVLNVNKSKNLVFSDYVIGK